jgi:hypothetical protein
VTFTTTTLAEIRIRLQDRWKNLPFWTDADATQGFNAAVRFWNLLTGQWKRTVLVPSDPANYLYTVPGTLTQAFRVSWNALPLTPGSIEGLNMGVPNWRMHTVATVRDTRSGEPVPVRPTIFAPVGLLSFAIWPRDVSAANSLTLDGVAATPILVNPGDSIDIGEEEEGPLLDETLHVMAFKIGGSLWLSTFPRHRRFLLAAIDRNSRIKANFLFRRLAGLDTGRQNRPLRVPISPEALALFTRALGSGDSGGDSSASPGG